jgi:hypothetical protein
MALKITKQIGTSKGIVENTYLRIEKYEIDKPTGTLKVSPSLYTSEQSASMFDELVSTIEINSSLYQNFSFTHTTDHIQKDYYFKLTSSLDNTVDLSPIIGSSVFEYAYPLLKEKIETVFGTGSVEDC